MRSKKRGSSTASSSSSDSSTSNDSSSDSSADSRSSSEERANKKKHSKASSSSKGTTSNNSKKRKQEHSDVQNVDDHEKKNKRDAHLVKHNKPGTDDHTSSHYHSNREDYEHGRKEKNRNRDEESQYKHRNEESKYKSRDDEARYRNRDDESKHRNRESRDEDSKYRSRNDESRSSKHEERFDRKYNDDKRKETDRYNNRRHGDRDRYEYHERKRDSHGYKQGGFRGENRDNYERRGSPKGGNRFKNDYRRDSKFRNRRDRSRSNSFDHSNAVWGRQDQASDKKEKSKPAEKEKPNFGLSGKLTEETNTYRGVVIKYSEPPEARKPRRRWRLYPFKGEKALQTLYIHRESAYLIGRERKVVDLPVDHPSCSKQHAALQYRLVPFTRDDGSAGKRVRPYLIDLESANGTYINNKRIESRKYVELLEKDVIKFGYSSREYVLLHENSKDETLDDDVKQEEEEVKVKAER